MNTFAMLECDVSGRQTTGNADVNRKRDILSERLILAEKDIGHTVLFMFHQCFSGLFTKILQYVAD